jgi:hypothetical protein
MMGSVRLRRCKFQSPRGDSVSFRAPKAEFQVRPSMITVDDGTKRQIYLVGRARW